jgi:hypothetical protein
MSHFRPEDPDEAKRLLMGRLIGDPSEVPGIRVNPDLDVCTDVPPYPLGVVIGAVTVVGGLAWMLAGYAALKLWETLR